MQDKIFRISIIFSAQIHITYQFLFILDFPDLNGHVRTAHGVEGVVCPHCSKILAKTCTLSRHIEQVHLNLQIHKPAQCGECGKVFSKKGHLDRHVKTIHMGKNLIHHRTNNDHLSRGFMYIYIISSYHYFKRYEGGIAAVSSLR